MIQTLDSPIGYIKNIGPERAKLIQSVLGIQTLEDFFNFSPIRFVDKTKVFLVKNIGIEVGKEVQLCGTITELKEISGAKVKRLSAKFTDASGSIDLLWFQYSKWLIDQIPQHKTVYLYGRVNQFNQSFNMSHPEIELETNRDQNKRLYPIYPSSEKLVKRGLTQKFFYNTINYICTNYLHLIEENLSENLLSKYRLMPRREAYIKQHFPQNRVEYEQSEYRFKFEEAFFFQLGYTLKKINHHKTSMAHPFPNVGYYFNDFYKNHLSFELTGAQKKVFKEIRSDLKLPKQMNRLLQGDVGSGKTIVALLSMLLALDNGFQSCLVAPTEILAQQHYKDISALLYPIGLRVGLLTGSTKTAERKRLHTELLNGELSILIGTHALFENKVQFKSLGLAIIDEQHRFGVAQRASLWAKNEIPPHILVMTATPIPRTLAMSFYSDLEVSIINELPKGRKPIVTAHRREEDRWSVFSFVKEEISKGRQIYFVYPLIEESEILDYKNLMEGAQHIQDFYKDENICIIHGKLKPNEKEKIMQDFAVGNYQIMVATTVIEVGVNVPNATVMLIESAERFGLSQLHQLRGRVGRGAEQSYCILMTSEKLTKDGRKRIKTMTETNDGFKISEVDLELRGPGDILGTQQSGVVDFKKLDLVQDGEIIYNAKKTASDVLQIDPSLSLPEHQKIKNFYIKHFKKRIKWGKIS